MEPGAIQPRESIWGGTALAPLIEVHGLAVEEFVGEGPSDHHPAGRVGEVRVAAGGHRPATYHRSLCGIHTCVRKKKHPIKKAFIGWGGGIAESKSKLWFCRESFALFSKLLQSIFTSNQVTLKTNQDLNVDFPNEEKNMQFAKRSFLGITLN